MHHTGINRAVTALLLLLLSVSLVQGEEVSKEEVKTLPLKNGGDVVLQSDEGNVNIHTWAKQEIQIRMTKRAWAKSRRDAEKLLDRIVVDIDTFGKKIMIRERDIRIRRNRNLFDLFDGDFWRLGTCVDFDITVPQQTNIKVECDEGDLDVTGLSGDIKILVDEGDVTLDHIRSDDIHIRMDEGDVECSDVRDGGNGIFKADLDEGDITIEDSRLYSIDISCDEGRIALSGTETGKFWFSTDEGDVYVDFDPQENGRYEIQSDEGDVRIQIPDDANLSVSLYAEDGSITNEFSLGRSRDDDAVTVRGDIGSGEGLLKVRVDEGSIRLTKK